MRKNRENQMKKRKKIEKSQSSLLPTAKISNAPIAAAITVTTVTGDVLAVGASDAETEVVLPAESSTCVE